MSISPPVDRLRRRSRQTSFDLNRSTYIAEGETSKPSTPSSDYQRDTGRMTQQGEGQIRDLSSTIISNPSNRPLISERTSQGVGEQVPGENMKLSIQRLVNQSVESQMSDMKRMIADLTSTVGKLSVMVRNTQEEHKKIIENNLPSTSKAAKEAQEQYRMDEIQASTDHSSRSSSMNGRFHYTNENRPRVDKWGLEFDGDRNKLAVEDFVFRVERLQSRYGVPWREVLDNFHLLVKGQAEKWYWLFIQTNYVTEWTSLKEALLKQYQSTRSSFELMRDMVERRQLPGESIDSFFFSMMQLRSRLTISMPEAEMIKMIKKNLREGIGRIVYPLSVSSVEELKTCCIDAEKTFLRRDMKPHQMPPQRFNRQVNELYEGPVEDYRDEELEMTEVAELMPNHNNQSTRPLNCWNCRQNGHVFMDCPAEERSIFCYRCGKPDVITPTCSNCRGKNFRKNEGRAGDHRSATNPQ